MPLPAISVIIPLYNKEREVLRAVHSVLAQSFQNFELIVVNDGSTDNGPAVVKSFDDSRIIFMDQQNGGVSVARNRGIAAAQTDLIAFLDADDEWTEDYLQTILRLVNKFPDASVFATGYMFKQSGGHEHRAIVRGLPTDFSEGMLENYFAVASHSDPPICSSTVTVRKKAIESVSGFPVGINAGEDLLTWARLAANFQIAYSIAPKAYFHEPLNADARPGRTPASPDTVAQCLRKLLEEVSTSQKEELAKYIAHWHTMRAVIFFQLAHSRPAREELRRAISIDSLDAKRLLLIIFSLLPGSVSRALLNFLKRIRTI